MKQGDDDTVCGLARHAAPPAGCTSKSNSWHAVVQPCKQSATNWSERGRRRGDVST